MYDPFTRGLIENLPDLDGLTSDGTRRTLSRTYLALTNLRLIGTTEASETTFQDILFLRRLANTLESRAVFDTEVGTEERRASAFVAAEALAILANFGEIVGSSTNIIARIEREEIFSRVEAALLYIISGYDANSGGVVRAIPNNQTEFEGDIYQQAQFGASEWTLDVIINLCKFYLNPLPDAVCPVHFVAERPNSVMDLQREVRGRLFARLGESVRAYMGWLCNEVPEGLGTAREQLIQITQLLTRSQQPSNADIHHLARLLLAVLDATEDRSLVHSVPPPDPDDAGDYQTYLQVRAKGDKGGSGRPLLWPSVQEYVVRCLPGPNRHAVVSMPTGSGKSFLGELAASQAAQDGWVLYLVPTNALAHQTRRDLRKDLSSLEIEVRAFIGDSEYTTLEEERVGSVPSNTIAVMTPEKCSLALRLNPEVFSNCTLCIFDECHLISEKSRGKIAEIVLSQLMVLAPDCCFLLMSAMVQNPDVLADWLHEATGGDSLPIPLKWRPTRSLRCAVGLDNETLRSAEKLAKERLELKADHRKNEEFETDFALLAGLQGAWQTNEELDYTITKLPAQALMRVHREQSNDRWHYEIQDQSWVNESSRRLGEMLAESRVPTLIFLPRSKHDAFSVGKKIKLTDEILEELPDLSGRVIAFLTLADDDLGLDSDVGNLIELGISVHTAALLETEKFASEEAFRDGSTIIMLATGTLAQGLNFPAIAVIIGGTRIGYSYGEDPEVVEQRKVSQLLNASGRAGRAGFANQGLVLAVPDKPIGFSGYEAVSEVTDQVSFLTHVDAAIEISSTLEKFVDQIASGSFDPKLASADELVITTLLVDDNLDSPAAAEVLRRTYAAYARQRRGLNDGADDGASRLSEVRTEFVFETNAPEWLPIAAYRAGLNFFTALRLLQAWQRVIPELNQEIYEWDMERWLSTLFNVLQYLTPQQVEQIFGLESLNKFMRDILLEIQGLEQARVDNDDPEWNPSESWKQEWQRIAEMVELWMRGESIKNIAAALLGQEPKDISSERNAGSKPIPKTIDFINKIIDQLAILAGGIVAIVEEDINERRRQGETWPAQIPFELSSLPLSIKYGCNSPQTLAWYRFGIRLRRPAHLLERAFPLHPTVRNDNELATVVHDLRRRWLKDELKVPQSLRNEYGTVFNAVKTIIESAY